MVPWTERVKEKAKRRFWNSWQLVKGLRESASLRAGVLDPFQRIGN